MLNRLKNTTSASKPTKSLGDSIKRHIFHKNLISKNLTKQQRSSPSTAFDVSAKSYYDFLIKMIFNWELERYLFYVAYTVSLCLNYKLSSSKFNRSEFNKFARFDLIAWFHCCWTKHTLIPIEKQKRVNLGAEIDWFEKPNRLFVRSSSILFPKIAYRCYCVVFNWRYWFWWTSVWKAWIKKKKFRFWNPC